MPEETLVERKVRECLLRHPDWPAWRVSKSVSGARSGMILAFRAAHPELGPEPPSSSPSSLPSLPPPPKPVDSGLISLDRIRERYDILAAIRRELAAIPRGKLISETELCSRAAGYDRNRFRRTVENNEAALRTYRVKLRLDDGSDGKHYWGHPDDVADAARVRDS